MYACNEYTCTYVCSLTPTPQTNAQNVIIEKASSIIRGVNRFSKDYSDVALFGKILRNEVDEEFRFIHESVKRTVAELLRVYIKSKHPLKVCACVCL